MRPSLTAVMTTVLVLGALPSLAADTEETASPEGDVQRVDVPIVGLSIAFPADWRVSTPEGTRVSEIQSPQGDPVYSTTAVLANGGGGVWCDVDVYLDMIATLDEHAHAYVAYLQQIYGAGAAMVLTQTDLPVGPAYRIDLLDRAKGKVRGMYLFDGPTADDGSYDRFVLTCAADATTEPFWNTVAESVVLSPPTGELATGVYMGPDASVGPEASTAPEASPSTAAG